MTQKRDPDAVTRHIQELAEDDNFLTQLSLGSDPSNGTDPLAQLLLDARNQVHAQMPPAPNLAAFGFDVPADAYTKAQEPHEAELGLVSATPSPSEEELAPIVPLRGRRRIGNVASALIGAAAATLLIAGGGAVLANSTPGSPLYAASQQVFGGAPDVVQLASTLEQAGDRSASGDVKGAQELLEQAQELVNLMSAKERAIAQAAVDQARTEIVTTTATATATVVSEAPAVTETVRETITATETVVVTHTPSTTPSSTTEPTSTPSVSATATPEPHRP